MNTPSNNYTQKSLAHSQPKSQSNRRSTTSKDMKPQSLKKPMRTKNGTDNYTVSVAKILIVRSKMDVNQIRPSRAKLAEAIDKELAEKEEKSKIRKEKLDN